MAIASLESIHDSLSAPAGVVCEIQFGIISPKKHFLNPLVLPAAQVPNPTEGTKTVLPLPLASEMFSEDPS